MMKNKFEEIIGQLQQERDDKIAECEQVKAQVSHHVIIIVKIVVVTQVLTGQKLDVIKLRVAEEIEAPYRKVKHKCHLKYHKLEGYSLAHFTTKLSSSKT